MFAAAYAIASQFTRPVVISHRRVNGKCASGIGSFVVLNSDGWILTAFHIVNEMLALNQAVQAVRANKAQRATIESDGSLNTKNRRAQLRALPSVKQTTHATSARVTQCQRTLTHDPRLD
jgi:hypothetical protein